MVGGTKKCLKRKTRVWCWLDSFVAKDNYMLELDKVSIDNDMLAQRIDKKQLQSHIFPTMCFGGQLQLPLGKSGVGLFSFDISALAGFPSFSPTT